MTTAKQLSLFDLTNVEMVEQFHKAFSCAINDRSPSTTLFRARLIGEEFDELHDELVDWMKGEGSMPKVIKEAADLMYVLYGLAVTFKFDLDEAFRRVHESNMSKLGLDGKPMLREDGKVLKGPNYFEPDLTDLAKED